VELKIQPVSDSINFEFLTTCKTCRLADREDVLLLCDGCDDAYHTYCLSPQLPAVPQGEWLEIDTCMIDCVRFCPICQEDDEQPSSSPEPMPPTQPQRHPWNIRGSRQQVLEESESDNDSFIVPGAIVHLAPLSAPHRCSLQMNSSNMTA
jgi:hypothetical protein